MQPPLAMPPSHLYQQKVERVEFVQKEYFSASKILGDFAQ